MNPDECFYDYLQYPRGYTSENYVAIDFTPIAEQLRKMDEVLMEETDPLLSVFDKVRDQVKAEQERYLYHFLSVDNLKDAKKKLKKLNKLGFTIEMDLHPVTNVEMAPVSADYRYTVQSTIKLRIVRIRTEQESDGSN